MLHAFQSTYPFPLALISFPSGSCLPVLLWIQCSGDTEKLEVLVKKCGPVWSYWVWGCSLDLSATHLPPLSTLLIWGSSTCYSLAPSTGQHGERRCVPVPFLHASSWEDTGRVLFQPYYHQSLHFFPVQHLGVCSVACRIVHFNQMEFCWLNISLISPLPIFWLWGQAPQMWKDTSLSHYLLFVSFICLVITGRKWPLGLRSLSCRPRR